MKTLLTVMLLMMSIANVALFLFWLSLVHIEVSSSDQKHYIYESISTNLMILEVILGTVAFGAVLFGMFGYHMMKEATLAATTKRVDDYFKDKAPAVFKQCIAKTE